MVAKFLDDSIVTYTSISLRSTVDIHTFHASVTLNCTLTSMVVGIAACFSVVTPLMLFQSRNPKEFFEES